MATDYFKEMLHFCRNSVVEEFYERSVGSIFEKEENDASLEVWCWTNLDLNRFEKPDESISGTAEVAPSNSHYEPPTSQTSDVVGDTTQPSQCVPSQSTVQPDRLVIIDLDLEHAVLRHFIRVPNRLNSIMMQAYHLQDTHRLLRVLYVKSSREEYSADG
jgi:hypothetical protein